MTEPESPALEDTQATLKRIYALVETSTFADENDRSALIDQLNELRREIGEEDGAATKKDLPTSLHQALQTTEVLAIKQLVSPSNGEAEKDHAELSWTDLSETIKEQVSLWEANHPKLAVSFAKFNDVLAKLGI